LAFFAEVTNRVYTAATGSVLFFFHQQNLSRQIRKNKINLINQSFRDPLRISI